MKHIFLLLSFLLISVFCTDSYAQLASCTSNVPYFFVDLRGNPSGSWTSPSHTRAGSCCATSSTCTSFDVLIDTAAGYIELEIASGAAPGGSLFYQVNCGIPQPIGSPSWVTGTGPFHITFCKPGGNANTYRISSLPQSAGVIQGTTSLTMCTQSSFTIGISGGTWSVANPGIATINSSTGVITGVSAGTTVISYVVSSTLIDTATITVTTVPPITGSLYVCGTNKTTLSDATAGGTWSSSNTARATVNSSGIVTGVSTGTTTITYKLGTGCTATAVVSVNAALPAITGTKSVCLGATTTLADAAPLGTWASGNTAVATIASGSGLAASISTGTANITYSVPGGCTATAVLTVNANPAAIGGLTTMCTGSTSSLTDATPSGTWSSSNNAVATISSGGVTSGISAGTAIITYQLATGCRDTDIVQVNASPAAISAAATLCVGGTASATDATSGGTWSTGNPGIATIGTSSGVLSAIAAGTTTITYTLATGCKATKAITVNALPVISGTTTICDGSTTALSASIVGGTWSSSNIGIATVISSGTVTGVSPGTAVITYQLATGCRDTDVVLVNAMPASISGSGTVCAGSMTTFSDATAGGTWSSGSTGTATIGMATGIATGVAAGIADISYTLPTGCRTTTELIVNALPALITGTPAMCQADFLLLTDSTLAGVWTSDNWSVAPIGWITGVVFGMSQGTANVTYTTVTGCQRGIQVTVNGLPVIAGATTVCAGGTVTLSSGATGGTWSSSNSSIVSINSAGVATGIVAGTAVVTYRISTGCRDTQVLTVNTAPAAISGAGSTCVGSTVTLTDVTSGGTWSTSNSLIATITSGGVINPLAVGNVTITYTTSSGCTGTKPVTVNGLPVLSGAGQICPLQNLTLSSSIAGGTWVSGTATVATVDTSGLVTGVSAGTAPMTYTTMPGCKSFATITVNAQPSNITGPANLCMGTPATFMDATTGGTWSSSDITIATVTSGSGVVSGVSPGNTNITYTSNVGCIATTQVTINPLPVITGAIPTCEGWVDTLTSSMNDGNWGTASTHASVNTSGIVTGITAGTAAITYQTGAGCVSSVVVTVKPNPAPIVSVDTMCLGNTITMSTATAGGTWSCTYGHPLTIDSTRGTYQPIFQGQMYIVNFAANGCQVKKGIFVNAPLTILGRVALCKNLTTTLSGSVAGGTWASTSPGIATIDATGLVWGIVPGTAMISYKLSEGCYVGRVVTVDTATHPLQSSPICTPALHDLCIGNTMQMQPSIGANGTWMSSDTSVATVLTSPSAAWDGVVTAHAVGVTTLTYTFVNGCRAFYNYTVHTMPVITSSPVTVCKYAFAGPFTGSPTGGEWFATTTPSAPVLGIDINTSIAQGFNVGTSLITYRMYHFGGCVATLGATVNACGAKESGDENGVLSENLAKGYSIYPNPGYRDFTITQNIPEDGVNDVQVVNYMGQSVYQSNIMFKGGTGSLNLPNVPPGVYIIAIADKAREKNIIHLVVQR